MRLHPVSLLLGVALLIPAAGNLCAEDIPLGARGEIPLKTKRQHASYAIGMNIGRGFQSDGLVVDVDALLIGIKDALAGQDPQLTDEQMSVAMQALQREMQAKRGTAGANNKRQGEAFLVANAKKQGVRTLPSGLQLQILRRGNGPSPTLEDTVRTHYHGTLIDGTVFDSSVERGEPAVFPVNGVIEGWTEALQLMKVGDKWKLFIAPELAYEDAGRGRLIGPHATLVFEIELLGIEKDEPLGIENE